MEDAGKRLVDREFDILSRLTSADKHICAASASVKGSGNMRSTLQQKVEKFKDQLAETASIPSVNLEPKLVSGQRDLEAFCAEIEKFRAEVQTCRGQFSYICLLISSRYRCAVDRHLPADSQHRRDNLA